MSADRQLLVALTGSVALVALVTRLATHGLRLVNHHMDPSR